MKTYFLVALWSLGILWISAAPTVSAGELSKIVTDMQSAEALDLTKGTLKPASGPNGGKALLFSDATGSFAGRIDLIALGVNPKDFDLIKIEVKADRGAFMRIGVENHPNAADLSYWYILDSLRGPFEWKTIWVDLTRPEEIKSRGGKRQSWRKGMAEGSEKAQGIVIRGNVSDRNRKEQGPNRRIWLGKLRFVKEAVHLDWDQTKAPYTWGDGKDLVYTYPLTVTNKLDKPVTAKLRLAPFEAKEARAALEQETVQLKPKEAKTVKAMLTLPAAVAAMKEPLYCERFSAFARAEGIADSEVTIVRSSDPIHLTVTVPFPEEKMQFPLLPRPSKLPDSVLQFGKEVARQNAGARSPEALIEGALQYGLYRYAQDGHQAGQFRKTLTAAAYLYDFTGEEKYKQIATTLLEALPRIWQKWYEEYEKDTVREISAGIVSRWGERNHYVLGLGWLVMGTMRSPYLYRKGGGNGHAGSVSSLAYAFDIMASSLTPEERDDILEGFFVPAGLQCRNHYIGDSNQQATLDVTAMYTGLATRNWPLVSFAYSSEHGLQSIAKWCFDDDGIQIRKNYQTYTLRPMLWSMELLYGRGLNLYERDKERLELFVHANPGAKGKGKPFEDKYFWEFVEEERIKE